MTDVFSDPQGSEAETQPESQTEQPSDLLEKLVGEGKKFATVEDLARGKLEADQFIEKLKTEGKEMREVLKEMEEKVNKSETVRDILSESRGESSEDNQSPQYSTDEIVKLVDERLTQKTEAQRAKANRERANAALLKYFGNDDAKAREFVKSEAVRLGMDPKELGELSEKSPDAFLRIVGVNKPSKSAPPAFESQVNSEAELVGGQVRDAVYYSELRKKLGHRFFEPDIQQQRMRDAQQLGDRFYNK
jgi:vacuolar-type H+-ATPase subunit I/STV1